MEAMEKEKLTRIHSGLIINPNSFAEVDESYIIGSHDFNSRVREVYCQYCKYRVMTRLVDATCKKCNSHLITYLG